MRGGIVYRPITGIEGGITGDFISYSKEDRITALVLGPLVSDSILASDATLSRIKQAFPSQKPKTIQEFFEISYLFASQSGLMSVSVSRILQEAQKAGVFASMTMLGEGVFALGDEGHAFLCAHAPDPKGIFVCDIACSGPRITEISRLNIKT